MQKLTITALINSLDFTKTLVMVFYFALILSFIFLINISVCMWKALCIVSK